MVWAVVSKEELKDIHSPSIRVIKLRIIRWAGHGVRTGERRGAYSVLAGIPEGKRPFGRHRRRWEDNIKTYIQEV